MSQINPFSGYVAQGAATARQQSSEKTGQVRRAQALKKNITAQDEQLEHEVESSDAIVSIHDEAHSNDQPPQEKPKHQEEKPEEPANETPHLDLTA